MESPRKFNDCYFYYYSTCTKGDNCVFRHEPSALGCETMCTAWQHGKCTDKHCKLRHMELRKNRKQIPCYWENQPGGCRKKHCPFMHKNPDARTDGIAPSQPLLMANSMPGVPVEVSACPVQPPQPQPVPLLWHQQRQVVLDSAILGVLPASSDLLATRRVMPPHGHEAAPNPYGPVPVDPLVVNFEEESDNESAPSSTPTKAPARDLPTKCQELLLLEQIQAEAAALYSYDPQAPVARARTPPPADHRGRTLTVKYDRRSLDEISGKARNAADKRTSLDFKILSLDEIRARKKPSINSTRKRKLSTQESVTTTGNKVIKVVSNNSIVYKQVESGSQCNASSTKAEAGRKQSCEGDQTETVRRQRTISEQCNELYDLQDDLDECLDLHKIRDLEVLSKPRLIRNNIVKFSECSTEVDDQEIGNDVGNLLDDDDVQIIDDSDNNVIEVIEDNETDAIEIVDLSDDPDSQPALVNIDYTKNLLRPPSITLRQ